MSARLRQAGGERVAESKVVVYAALAGNSAIAVVKFVAAGFTGSSAMLSEAVHSVVDTLDQLLLLVGEARGRAPPNPTNPFGYGLEAYFWSFTVALMVFLLGGAFSVYEGVQKVLEPGEAASPKVNYLVLGVAFLFEGASFLVGFRQYKRFSKGRLGLADFIRRSKDPNLFVTLLEDGAALIGLALAALGVTGGVLGLPWADGAASVAIGLLLVALAAVLANETRSLIAGESADSHVVEEVRTALEGCPSVERVADIATLQLGPKVILVAVTLDLAPGERALETASETIARHVHAVDERIARVYFRPSRVAAVAEGVPAQA